MSVRHRPSTEGANSPDDETAASIISVQDKTGSYVHQAAHAAADQVELAHLSPPLKRQRTWRDGITGWRAGASTAVVSTALVLFINIITVLVLGTRYGAPGGLGTIFTGSCKRVQSINTVVHVVINILSTVLLSASNYCMQCLSAPTRDEIDRAHAHERWLDIGVPSIRNLFNINRKRVWLWWLLGISSIPLHLVFNSAIFSALAVNNYRVIVATKDFEDGAASGKPDVDVAALQDRAKSLTRLDNRQCISEYAQPWLSRRRDVILVTNRTSSPEQGALMAITNVDFSVQVESSEDVTRWICKYSDIGWGIEGEMCSTHLAELVSAAESWHYMSPEPGYTALARNWDIDEWLHPEAYERVPIEYCLSEEVEEACSLQYSLYIMLIVIACNVGKMVAMAVTIFGINFRPLITVGDAIASFLEVPDAETKGVCTSNKRDFSRYRPIDRKPSPWHQARQRWARAASVRRWAWCLFFFLCAMIATSYLLAYGLMSLAGPSDFGYFWSLGFGAINAASLIGGWAIPRDSPEGLTQLILIANAPQPILSFLYLIFNGLVTCMFLAEEWSNFAHQKKPLRVSRPRGLQRSTYFLELPYRYAIPLIAVSGLLHWLVSQSIFVASVLVSDQWSGRDRPVMLSTCGYSPMPIIFIVFAGVILLLSGVVLGFRRYKPGMPLAGSCSMAIAAACHVPPDEIDPATKPLQWGVSRQTDETEPDTVGHCSFSSREVTMPVPGRLYA
ncbi:MAG: hypothetical protein M1817_001049 [Caeruleum heppii]|nr:MAG: hypothetical protein M1817_001049 [Caeruleum heppii]